MVERSGVADERLLEALRRVPRAEFVPPEHAVRAYRDEPIPIPHGQVTTQPSLVARMVEALSLDGAEAVLEVGTGFGFQSAVLAQLAGHVWSVERWGDIAETARRNLALHGAANVEVIVGDGSLGLPERAPFEAIIVSAAFPRVPEPLVEQLVDGGRLVHPLGPGGAEDVVLFEKEGSELRRRHVLCGARFVKLYGSHGFSAASRLPPGDD
jgi:protein-L-isoaspartate(D-aspartate) O-methyltransferase